MFRPARTGTGLSANGKTRARTVTALDGEKAVGKPRDALPIEQFPPGLNIFHLPAIADHGLGGVLPGSQFTPDDKGDIEFRLRIAQPVSEPMFEWTLTIGTHRQPIK